MSRRLEHKVCLITGAARGIGLACAAAFAREGAKVILTDLDRAGGSRAASVLAESGASAEFHHLDVRDEALWIGVIDAVTARHGRLDVLVNNAGITGFEPMLGPQDPVTCSLETWRAVHATNLEGVFLGCKHAIPAMIASPTSGSIDRSDGSIINMSSRSGVVGIPGACAYASSKAGVRNHTKSVALHCAERGLNIRCNSVHPATILTPMWDPLLGAGPDRDRAVQELADEIPLGRVGMPDDVTGTLVFLASDESRFITGAEFTIDGGLLAGSHATPKRDS